MLPAIRKAPLLHEELDSHGQMAAVTGSYSETPLKMTGRYHRDIIDKTVQAGAVLPEIGQHFLDENITVRVTPGFATVGDWHVMNVHGHEVAAFRSEAIVVHGRNGNGHDRMIRKPAVHSLLAILDYSLDVGSDGNPARIIVADLIEAPDYRLSGQSKMHLS